MLWRFERIPRMPVAVCFVLLCSSITGQTPYKEDPPFVLPPSVEVQQDQIYARYGQREMHLDLYLPRKGGPFPGVVWIHGGGWESGDRTRFRRQAALLAAKGFVNACIEHRLSGEAIFPAALEDAKASVRYLRANAARYRINSDKIGVIGASSGGHLAALLGTTGGVREFEGNGGHSGFSSRVQAVVVLYPALDLPMLGTKGLPPHQRAVAKFLGKTYAEDPKLWTKASPPTYVNKDSAPFLFMHGTEDKIPYVQSVNMMKQLQAAGVHAELFTAEGTGHNFANRPEWFTQVLERIEQFLTQTLK